MTSQKISSFNVATSLNDSDLFTFVVNGTNKNVSFTSFKSALGVTGTLTAIGDPLAVPVLQEPTPGDFQIRAIENGAGIFVSVSPEDGVKLDWNVAQDILGVPLTSGLTNDQPVISSLVEGAGIQIRKFGDEITISATAGSGGLNQDQMFYVAKAGNDLNTGLNVNSPKLTIAAAISSAIAILPAVDNQITIEVIDTGTYFETYELPEWVHINALNAANNGRITVNDSTIIRFRRLQNSTATQPIVRKTDGTGFARITCDLMIVVGSSQEGLLVNMGLAHLDAGVVDIDAGVGIKAKNGARISFIVPELLMKNGALGLGTRTAGGDPNFTSGILSYAVDTDDTCTLVESKVTGDILNLQAGSLTANTLYDMGAGTTLNVFATEAEGARIKDPTATVNSSIAGNIAILTTMRTRAAFGNTVADTGVIPIALTGTGDSLLPPPSTAQPVSGGSYNGYERVTGLVEITADGELTVSNDSFIIGTNGGGDYRTPHAWVDMSSNVTATTVGFVFGIVKASDGLVHYSQRVTGSRMAAQDDRTNTSGGGFVTSLEAGDTLSMWVAADKTATITIYDMNIGLEMSIAESLK